MSLLLLGLVIFLGVHSVRMVADDWRSARVAALGLGAWKGLYTLVSLIGLVLVVWGFGLARTDSPALWHPAAWTRHLASLLTWIAFVLIVAAYVPRSRLRAAVGHPMLTGVILWALAHLFANGRLVDLVLFGAFLVWALLDFRSVRVRERAAGAPRPAGLWANDLVTVVVGTVAWFVFAMYLHEPLMGVRPI